MPEEEEEEEEEKKKDMESEKASVVLSKDNLLLHFFEAVDSLYPPAPGEGFEAMTLRLLEVKKRITQSDPHWKLKDSGICCVYRILSFLEKMDANASFVYNHALGLKICKQITLLTKALRPMTETKSVQVVKKTRARNGHGKKRELLKCSFVRLEDLK